MKKILLYTCFLFPLSAFGQQKKGGWLPSRFHQKNKMLLAKQLLPKRFALLVGISTFQDAYWSNLRYARNDLKRMKQMLKSHGHFDDITTLKTTQQTTKDSILKALNTLKKKIKHPQDTVVIYFSSHGTLAKAPTSEEHTRYIVTHDTNTNISSSGLSIKRLKRILHSFRSKRILLLLATCYTGQFGSKSKVAKGTKGKTPSFSITQSSSMLILSASSYQQPAFESKQLQGDVYTYYFVSCWKQLYKQKLPNISAFRIHACAVKPTYQFVAKHFGQTQLPGLESKISGLDSIFLSSPSKAQHTAPTKKENKSYLQILRTQLQHWKINIWMIGAKSQPLQIQEKGDLLFALKPGRYQVALISRKSKEKTSFPIVLGHNERRQLSIPQGLSLMTAATFSNNEISVIPFVAGISLGLSKSFWSAHIQYSLGQGSFSNEKPIFQHILSLQSELAWKPTFAWFTLECGGFVNLGVQIQDAGEVGLGPFLRTGGLLAFNARLSPKISIRFPIMGGISILPINTKWKVIGYWSIQAGISYHF